MEFEKLKKVIAEVLNVDPEEITMETTFMDDLGADSLDVFQIVMGIEEEFDIEIPAEKAEKITTVEEAVELIKSATNQYLKGIPTVSTWNIFVLVMQWGYFTYFQKGNAG